MKTLVKTKNMSREEWKKWRCRGIGGSDASIILGLSKYRSILQLWKEKTGREETVEEEDDGPAYFGHVFESIIRKEFTKRTNYKVRSYNRILQSEEHLFMLANLDGVVKDDDGYAIFEAKNISEYRKSEWEEGVPAEYVAQVQHYMKVTGWSKAYVCAIVGGNKFYCHIVYRDEEYINWLVEKETAFWDCVVDGLPPLPDGSKATGEFLNREYPVASKNITELPFHAEKLVCSYVELEKELDVLKTKKDEVANQLKDMLKDNERGVAGQHTVNWTNVQKRTLDTAKVKEALGDSYNDYLTTSTYRRFSVA